MKQKDSREIVRKIVAEVKHTILFNLLEDMHNYDGRFDSNHIFDIEDAVRMIVKTEINDRFVEDVKREIEA